RRAYGRGGRGARRGRRRREARSRARRPPASTRQPAFRAGAAFSFAFRRQTPATPPARAATARAPSSSPATARAGRPTRGTAARGSSVDAVQLFHYHLVTSKVREVEARYIAKLGFQLVARYGRIGDEQTYFEAGVPWEELDPQGFRLRLSEPARGAVHAPVP